uniref:Uncharacterized protein n=1 Tax=Anopheles christyi TaxID=43041 RepID=A0A182JXZ2_9DIPT
MDIMHMLRVEAGSRVYRSELSAVNQLSEAVGHNLTALKIQSKEHRDILDQKLSELTGAIHQLSQKIGKQLQYKLLEMDLTMREDRESIDQKLSHQESRSDRLLWAISQLSQTMGHNFTTL